MKTMSQNDTHPILFVVLGKTEHELVQARETMPDTEICTGIFAELGTAEHSLNAALDQCSACRMVVIAAHENGNMLQNALALAQFAKERGILAVVMTPNFGRTPTEYLTEQSLTMEKLLSQTDCVLWAAEENFYQNVRSFQQYLTAMLDDNNFICLDFEDISSVLEGSGFAYFGTTSITGVDTAERKARIKYMETLPRDILEKAKGVVMHIVGSYDIGLEEVEATAELIQPQTHPDAIIVFGAAFDEDLRSKVQVSILAAGISN